MASVPTMPTAASVFFMFELPSVKDRIMLISTCKVGIWTIRN
jgi:hypothetical protein